MTATNSTRSASSRRAYTLAVLVIINVLCAVFFIVDVIGDFKADGFGAILAVEALAAVALLVTTVLFLFELRDIMERQSAMEIGISAARGEMGNLINRFFDEWKLTDTEKQVGQLILKGFDNDTIATIRGTAGGTVRAQSTSIYAKAGVDGRSQLMSIFMEELLGEPLVPNGPAPGTNTDQTQAEYNPSAKSG